jgi:transporter family-2 protein
MVNMGKLIIQALMVALLSGLAIGVQSSLIGSAGKITGAVLTGLVVNFFAGAASGLLMAVMYARQGKTIFAEMQVSTVGMVFIAGILGVGIIAGIAYALPKIGVAAGLSMIISGQMIVAVVVDTLGLTGEEPIPLSWVRIGGLVLLVLGTWAIVPKR